MRQEMEHLLHYYGADIVLQGHVHSCALLYPVGSASCPTLFSLLNSSIISVQFLVCSMSSGTNLFACSTSRQEDILTNQIKRDLANTHNALRQHHTGIRVANFAL